MTIWFATIGLALGAFAPPQQQEAGAGNDLLPVIPPGTVTVRLTPVVNVAPRPRDRHDPRRGRQQPPVHRLAPGA